MSKKDWLKDYRLLMDAGNGKQRWEYCGKYFSFDLPRKEIVRFKLFLILLSVLQSAIAILIGFVNNPGSRNFLIVIPYMLMMLTSMAGVWNSMMMLSEKAKLTCRVYERNYLWLLRGTVVQMVACVILILAEMLYIIFGAAPIPEIIVILGGVFVAVGAVIQRAGIRRHPCKPV